MSKGVANKASTFRVPSYLRSATFWNRPRRDVTGHDHESYIHIGVGHVLSNWEDLEGSLSVLFATIVQASTIAAERAYGTIGASRGRADALREAGRVFFTLRRGLADQKDRKFVDETKKAHDVFELIIDNYGHAGARRNDVAHGIAYGLSDFENGPNYLLVAPLYQAKRTRSWIADDIKMRRALQHNIRDTSGTARFSKLYLKNTEYMYDAASLKVLAGKIGQFSIDVCRFTEFLVPGRYPGVNFDHWQAIEQSRYSSGESKS